MTQLASVDIVQNEFSAIPYSSIDLKTMLLHSDASNVPIERYERTLQSPTQISNLWRTNVLNTLVNNLDFISEASNHRFRSFLKAYVIELDRGYGFFPFTKNLPDIEHSAITQNDDDINSTEKSKEFFELIFGILKQLAFLKSDEYEDPLGGNVIDYFRDNERITCIVSSQRIQILSYIQGNFKEWNFVRMEIDKAGYRELYGESFQCRKGKQVGFHQIKLARMNMSVVGYSEPKSSTRSVVRVNTE